MRKSLLTVIKLIALPLLATGSAQAVEPVVTEMEEAANAFIGSLTKELTARAVLPMEAEESVPIGISCYHRRTQGSGLERPGQSPRGEAHGSPKNGIER